MSVRRSVLGFRGDVHHGGRSLCKTVSMTAAEAAATTRTHKGNAEYFTSGISSTRFGALLVCQIVCLCARPVPCTSQAGDSRLSSICVGVGSPFSTQPRAPVLQHLRNPPPHTCLCGPLQLSLCPLSCSVLAVIQWSLAQHTPSLAPEGRHQTSPLGPIWGCQTIFLRDSSSCPPAHHPSHYGHPFATHV